MLKNFKGKIGEFSYNTDEWLVTDTGYIYLTNSKSQPTVPKGLKKLNTLLQSNSKCGTLIPKELSFKNFKSLGVENMDFLFFGSRFPEGYSLEGLETLGVKSMKYMFQGCTFPKNFIFGSKFSTENVENMDCMFLGATFYGDVDLSNFDTSKVKSMDGMFQSCTFYGDVNLGSNFDTSNVESMLGMFSGCKFLGKVNLGDKFSIKGNNPENVFRDAKLPEGFSLK